MKTKATSKIMMAALALVMALALATGTTFAWFSMNNTVTVTGMTVSTKVSNNLLIAETTTGATAALTDSAFKTSYVAGTPIDALLEPVSTTNGTSFFYTSSTNVGGSGAVTSAVYTEYDPDVDTDDDGVNDFNENAGTTGAVGYVDYAFQLKANNTSASAPAYINVTALNLVYGSTQTPVEYAFRVAIFVEDIGTALAATSGNVGTLKTVLKPASAAYFTANKAVNSTSTVDTVSNLGTAANLATVTANSTHFYKVVVRLWLEGEDTTCNNNTFAQLTDNWALDITIQLQDATGGVSALATSTTASKIDLSGADIDGSGTNVVIDGTTYYPLDEDGYYTNANSFGASSRVFTITNNHPTEVTHKCTLPTT